jgi:hypothetical protein
VKSNPTASVDNVNSSWMGWVKNDVSEKFLPYIIVTVFFVFCSIIHSPLCRALAYDSEVYYYIGMLIANDGIPYVDVFDHKPPLIYLLSYVGYTMSPTSVWGVFILIFSIGLASTLLLFTAAKRLLKSTFQSLIVTFVYTALVSYPYLLQESFLTRQVVVYLVVILWSSGMLLKSRSFKFFVLGIISSLIFFTQQNEVLAVCVWLLYFVSERFAKKLSAKILAKNFISTVFGALVPFILMTGLLFYWNNIEEFWNDSFLFNISYSSQQTWVEKIVNTLTITKSLIPITALFLTLVVLNFVRFRHLTKTLILCFIVILIQFISTALSGKAYSHYYLSFIPYLVFWLAYTFKNHPDLLGRKSINIIALGIILIVVSFKHLGYISIANPYSNQNPIYDEVHSVSEQKGQFYSFEPAFLRINHGLEIVAPSKWVYSHFAFTKVDPDGLIMKEILNDLDAYETKYILKASYKTIPLADQYLESNYRLIINHKDNLLYIRSE